VAEVVVLHHPTTIGPNYQPVVHCLTVCQACRVVSVDSESGLLRSSDRAHVTFEFMYRPEYLVLGARIIFREGRTKGIGKICALHFTDGTTSEPRIVPAALGALSTAWCAGADSRIDASRYGKRLANDLVDASI